jgi:CheY-like chemotaxis protein
MLRRLIGEQVRLVTRLETAPAVVLADPGQLEQVLVNLAINARDAMPEGGAVDIAVSCVADAARLGRVMTGPAVLITVKDDGAGMDDETLTHAFEPFFTTKPTGAGTGLGLATVHGIVLQSKGEIWAESAIGLGTTVSVLLAQIEATPEPLAEQPSSESNVASAATVLVAEDDAAVRAFVVLVLQRAGYRVLVAGSAAEAEALTDGLAEPIDVLLTDLMMPETNGQMLAQRLTAKRPGMRVILMSGYGPELSAVPLDPSLRFLAKPFSGEDLAAIVAAALAEPVVP